MVGKLLGRRSSNNLDNCDLTIDANRGVRLNYIGLDELACLQVGDKRFDERGQSRLRAQVKRHVSDCRDDARDNRWTQPAVEDFYPAVNMRIELRLDNWL